MKFYTETDGGRFDCPRHGVSLAVVVNSATVLSDRYHGRPEMMDASNPIEVAIGWALRLLRRIDAIPAAELELMREDGLLDEPLYRELVARTGASDFTALVAGVKHQVPAATDEEINETLTIVAAAELAEGDPEPISIVKLLKGAPGIH